MKPMSSDMKNRKRKENAKPSFSSDSSTLIIDARSLRTNVIKKANVTADRSNQSAK
jgi:hypothetical protein